LKNIARPVSPDDGTDDNKANVETGISK